MTVDKAALRALADTLNGILLPEGYNRQALKDAAVALPALLAENDALRAELQARQWISTSDQMPRENDLVLACHIDGDIEIVFGHLLHETKQDGAYSHWQTLPPAPPQGETA